MKGKINIAFLLFCCLTCVHFTALASHIFGGAITYECDGTGRYIFQLVIYRDCNGADVSTSTQQLKVWNHPTLNSITLNYVSRENSSPQGTQVPGGPACFDCVTGGNIGLGSIEKISYKSMPVQISGTPPESAWVFTFDDFSRNGNISNIQNPLNYGTTLRAKIYNVGTSNNTCNDKSVQFLQTPHFVTCTGKPYKLNLNPVDPDLDSVKIEWDKPLNYLANNPYNEGVNPVEVPYVNGYRFDAPTPGVAMNGNNQNAQLNQQNGELTFLSQLAGNFVVKLKATSYRNGRVISIVEHEFQVVVTNCTAVNNAPQVTGPFGGLWETTVNAGDLVQFSVKGTDNDNLQNGSPQSVRILTSGLLFGSNPQLPTGCILEPCPTINGQPVIGVQNAQVQVNWQTSCEHLRGFDANELDVVPYQFVFRIQDDFCPIPEVAYYTATVNVRNPGVLPATKVTCIQGAANNVFTINWNEVPDPNGRFVAYEVYSVEGGLIATINNRTTTSYTTTMNDDFQWYIATVSGCDGNARRYSDTLRNMYLNLSNANLGIAVLDWNRPINPARNGMGATYRVFKEYPAGTWTSIHNAPYNSPQFQDVISVCSEFINYYVEIDDQQGCMQRSQISGNNFSDQTPPDLANMTNVSIDTLTGMTTISWNRSPSPDTYGYIIYKTDPVSNWLVEMDTIWGANNTDFTYLEVYDGGPMNYTIAAFDSCPSPMGGPFNLSARDPNLQATIFLRLEPAICGGMIDLIWTPYEGWNVQEYVVFYRLNGGPWQRTSAGQQNHFAYQADAGDELQFVIQAIDGNGKQSFSAKRVLDMQPAVVPEYHFIEYASVDFANNKVKISYTLDPNVLTSKLELQREKEGQFVTIHTQNNPSNIWEYVDTDVNVDERSYAYRVFYYDTCGMKSQASNIARTMLLHGQIDQTLLQTYLNWSPYSVFNGSTIQYEVLRRIEPDYNETIVGRTNAQKWAAQDDVSAIETNGLVCYVVRAREGVNRKGESNYSFSNEVCLEVEPLLFVPNAFLPDGEINTIFIPVLRNVDVRSYEFTVINRWGQTVFKTNDIYQGWDGTIIGSNQKASIGLYNYMISFDLGFGEQFVKRGHVNLIR